MTMKADIAPAQMTVLPNGIRVVTREMPQVESVSLGLWVHVGTRDEAPEVNGVSHLLEHMAFKGTRRRTARSIAEEIEAVGGHLNAYTSREHTAYYAKVLVDDVPLAIDILADILQHSTLDEQELERERSVILQEIGQANDTPDDLIFDRFQETAYPDQPLGLPVLGSADLIRGLGRSDVRAYMDRYYSPSRLVASAAGRIDHEDFVRRIAAAFGDLPADNDEAPPRASYVGGDNRERRKLDQVHLILGFEGVPYGDPDYYAVTVLSTLLGGGMSSRLFQEVREKRGLVYSVFSFSSSYDDTGVVGVYAGTGEKEVGELIPVVGDELNAVRRKVGEDEIARARAQLRANVLMSLESTSAMCEQAARQILVFGRPIALEETVARIEAVDAAQVARTADRLFRAPVTVAALGPIRKMESTEQIAARFG
ncbi:MAG: pitrilysin family protein [Acetobacterales bacterium]